MGKLIKGEKYGKYGVKGQALLLRQWQDTTLMPRRGQEGLAMVYIGLYIVAVFLGLYVFAKWLGIIINLGFLLFMAVMLMLVIALGAA